MDSALRGLISTYVEGGRVPHLHCFVSVDGTPVADICAGRSRADGEAPHDHVLDKNALYRIASMSKPIVVAAFLTMVEEGRVSFGTLLEAVLPEFAQVERWTGRVDDEGQLIGVPNEMPMTMYDLLRHSAGLSYSFHAQTPLDRLYAERYLDTFHQRRNSAEYVQALADVPLAFAPGERFHYSASIDLLGLAMERIADQPLDDILAQRILQPLGMNDTGFVLRPDQVGRLTDAWQTDGAGALTLYDRGQQSRWRVAQKCYSAGGGLLSSTSDYHRFLLMLLGGGTLDGVRILSPESVDNMMANHLPGGGDLESAGSGPLSETSLPGIGMGLGGAVIINTHQARAAGSQGTYFWGGILSTGFFLDRSRSIIGLVMTQMMPSGAANLREDFRTAVYSGLD